MRMRLPARKPVFICRLVAKITVALSHELAAFVDVVPALVLAAAGGLIGLVRSGDVIDIDIPRRSISVRLSDEEIERRRAEEEARGEDAWTPHVDRPRKVSAALRAYAMLATSADLGAVRDLKRLGMK